MFFTDITVIFSEIFKESISVSGSTIIAFAPFAIAFGIKSVPFLVKPFIATKRPFSSIFLESELILVISKFRFPIIFIVSDSEIIL